VKNLLIGLLILGSTSAIASPSLQSVLSTGHLAGSGNIIRIKMAEDGKAWEIKTQSQCPSYPCYPADYASSETVLPKTLQDQSGTDGCLVVELDSTRRVSACSSFGPIKYRLILTEDGTEKIYDLTLSAFISP
jgi:hypothetical protein